MSIFGWAFAIFGFSFALLAVNGFGLDDAVPRNWIDAGKGKITRVVETGWSTGGDNKGRGSQKIYAYHFEATNNEIGTISGISYGFKGKYKTGDEVVIKKAGKRYRVLGLTLTGVSVELSLIFFGMGCLFGGIGLGLMSYPWFVGGKTIICLRDGMTIGAKYIGTSPTGVNVNGKQVMKANFEYQVDGATYTASASALDTSRLTDSEYKAVLYDPIKPKRSVVLDGLPSGIRLDEMTGQFCTDPVHLVLPFFASAIVGTEIAVLVVLVIRAI